jgi:two-component system sensor histidine kinase QseC
MSGAPYSLQRRLLALMLSVVATVWLATAGLTWLDVRHELDELLDGHLAQAAAILVVQQGQEVDGDHDSVDAPSLHRYAPRVAFQVFHEGRLSMRSTNAPQAAMAGDDDNFRSGFETVQIGGVAWRVFSAYGAERDVHVYVGEESGSRAQILWAVLRSTLLPMAIALPLLALALWWAIHSSVAPMRLLGRTLAQREPYALEPLSMDGAPAEISPMIDALNNLFERTGNLLESERRFTSDASHELRTPIAAIRAQAQVALGESDPVLRSHALRNTLEGCDRAIRLVEQLLTLSRLEAAAMPAMEKIDLAAMARQVVGDLASKSIAKGQSLEFDGAKPCPVAGNETLLAVLMRNLVDNAVRYSPASARVTVAVQRLDDGRVLLRVEDSGPGLSERDLNRLGERFFRVPGNDENGSGLGWSIVKRVAAVHHMQLNAGRSERLGGLAVTVTAEPLPSAADSE